MFPIQIIFLLIIMSSSFVATYKPVVIVHGILDMPDSLYTLANRITEKHPGTDVTIIDKLHGWRSMAPLWYQVKSFRKTLYPIMEQNPDGINVIGYSQGGLVARALIQSSNKHNVNTFISLSSPQAGQFGAHGLKMYYKCIDDFLRIFFPGYVKATAWKFFYSRPGQLTSVGNYWRDPHHIETFLNYSHFLPEINNEVTTADSMRYKRNFLKLQKLVLIGGPDDEVISPWQSSHFAVYDENEEIVPMQETVVYQNDTIGLRQLDKMGRIVTLSVPEVHHLQWHKNVSVIDKYIIPYLD